jgi:hypothetical protein
MAEQRCVYERRNCPGSDALSEFAVFTGRFASLSATIPHGCGAVRRGNFSQSRTAIVDGMESGLFAWSAADAMRQRFSQIHRDGSRRVGGGFETTIGR